MAGVLSAEDRAGLGHRLLDERVPDAVRTGTPPCSRIDLGDDPGADQVVARSWRPARFRASRPPRAPWAGSPLTSSARSSTRKTRSASPSNASPRRRRAPGPPPFRSSLVLGVDRVCRMVRERPVELAGRGDQRRPAAARRPRHDETAHAVGGVGHDGERGASRRRRRTAARARRRRRGDPACSTDPRRPRRTPGRSASARISRRPVPHRRRAPGRQNFSPLYFVGLWLAVIIDGREVQRAARRSTGGPSRRGRGRRRRSARSRPRRRRSEIGRGEPAVAAKRDRAVAGPATRTRRRSRRARSSSRSSGTTPRTSYALKMRSRSRSVTVEGILPSGREDRQVGVTCERPCRSPT